MASGAERIRTNHGLKGWIASTVAVVVILAPFAPADAAEKSAPAKAPAPKTLPDKQSAPEPSAPAAGTSAAKAAGTSATKAAGADEPAVETAEGGSPAETSVRGLSWDLKGGGIPTSGGLVEAALGFSGLPRLAYHHTLSPDLSIGGMVSFDYAYWAPSLAFASSLLLQAPIRFALNRSSSMSLGLRLDPGLGFRFASDHGGPFAFGLLLNGGISVGFTVQNRFIVGGGIDVPMAISIPSSGGTVNFVFPILIGPIFEFHVTPPLALTVDMKLGPHINSAGGTIFGLLMMAGIAYRL